MQKFDCHYYLDMGNSFHVPMLKPYTNPDPGVKIYIGIIFKYEIDQVLLPYDNIVTIVG
jgi:hypothetical protein